MACTEVSDSSRKKRLLLGCTGSVASLKAPELTRMFLSPPFESQLELQLVSTQCALHFFNVRDLDPRVEVFTDENEWTQWKQKGDPVLHIELAKWADAMVVAPLDANTLAKMAQGLCDNLLTCVARAWRPPKPLFFCPAMNTAMLQHPITAQHLSTLRSWDYTEIACVTKKLACGDEGLGAMAEVATIVDTVAKAMGLV